MTKEIPASELVLRSSLAVTLACMTTVNSGCQKQEAPTPLVSENTHQILWNPPSQDLGQGSVLVLAEVRNGARVDNEVFVRVQRFDQNGRRSNEEILRIATGLLSEALPGYQWEQVKDEPGKNHCPAFSDLCLKGTLNPNSVNP